MVLTFRGECIIDFKLKISNIKIPLTFFKDEFTDAQYVERYAGPRLNCKILDCRIWIAENSDL